MASRKSAKKSFEEDLHRLEQIVQTMEEGNVPLDDAVSLYEEGITISKSCAERLRDTELRIKKLTKELDGQFSVKDLGDE
jgi:exodeoxyribonuclease VII small subunit